MYKKVLFATDFDEVGVLAAHKAKKIADENGLVESLEGEGPRRQAESGGWRAHGGAVSRIAWVGCEHRD